MKNLIKVQILGLFSLSLISLFCINTNAQDCVPFNVNLLGSGEICEGENASFLFITLIDISNATTVTYHWTGPNDFASNSSSLSIADAQVSDSGLYSLQITADGCSSNVASTYLNVYPKMVGEAFNSGPVCTGESVTLWASFQPQRSIASFAWTGPNDFTSNEPMPKLDNVSSTDAGIYELVITQGACNLMLQTRVEVLPSPDISVFAPPIISCNEPAIQINAIINDEADNITLAWQGPGITANNNDVTSPTIREVGTYTLTATHIESGCTQTKSVEVVSDGGNYFNELNFYVCREEGISINDKLFKTDTTDIFFLTAQNGCDSVVQVNIFTSEIIATVKSKESCSDDGAIYISEINGGNKPYTIAVNDSVYDHVNTIENLPAGNYEIKITDALGCTLELFTDIEQIEDLGNNKSQFISVCEDSNILLTTDEFNEFDINSINFEWFDGSSGGRTKNVHATGTYWVDISNKCKTTRKQFVVSNDSIPLHKQFTIPTSFSPNHDGLNDEFRVYAKYPMRDYKLEIYNRWGQIIFATKDINDFWDGYLNGKVPPPGVYVWIVTATVETCYGDHPVVDKGNLTLFW